jgi:hypothetical protein
MKGILQKIEWKTHRWNLKFNLLDLYLHDGDGCWGFSFCEIVKDYTTYSLLSFEFRLPNGADRKVFQITNWDLFYISKPFWKWFDNESDRVLWGGSKPTGIQGILYKIADKLFK